MSSDDVASRHTMAVIQALVQLSYLEGYFEAKNEEGDAYAELRDRTARARDNLQASWADLSTATPD